MTTKSGRLPWELARFRNWVAVGKVSQMVRKMMNDALSQVDLDLPQYDVLSAVYRFPGLTQSELSDKLLVGRSNLSMLLPYLETQGLLRREIDADDRRVKRLNLTEKGQRLAEAGLEIQVRLVDYLSEAIDDDACDQVGDSMRRVGAFLEKNPFNV